MRAGSWLTIGTVVALAWSAPALAQYKWRDAQGRVSVSDRPPPPSVPARDILEQPIPLTPLQQQQRPLATPVADSANKASAAPVKSEGTAKERETDTARKRAETEAADLRRQLDEKNAATMRDNCTRARSSVRSLESGMRIARHNDAGEREILDDKQREMETARAREIVAGNCK